MEDVADFLTADIWKPMTEEEVANFDKEMRPRNCSKSAADVSLTRAEKATVADFDELIS